MPFVPIDFAQVIMTTDIPGPGSPAMNTWGTVAAIDAQDVADGIAAVLANTPGIRNLLDSNAIIRDITVRRNVDDINTQVGIASVDIAGTVSGVAAPPQVATLVRKSTAFAGRKNQGRMFLPASSNAVIGEDGVITGANLTTYQTGMTAFFNDMAAAGRPLYLLHEAPADTPTLVSALTVVALVATQRRRLR